MSRWDERGYGTFGGLPKPGPALTGVLVGLFAIWLMFAMAINWADASPELFYLFCGSTEAVLGGEIWRLATAPLLHHPSGGVSHIFFTLLGLYFLTPTLEERWGPARLLRFLFFSAMFAYAFQVLLDALLPASVGNKLVPGYWYGATPVLEAVAVAFALNFTGGTVRLMFLIPVTARGLLWFVIGISVVRLIAVSQTAEGLLSPFGGMLAGWLIGGGTPSPLRKLYLRFRLQQLDREVAKGKKARSQRAKDSPFRVIEGGRKAGSSDEKPAGGGRGPDGGWLN